MARETITINSVDYASNITLAAADEYLAVDPFHGTLWAAETDDDIRGKYLIAATRRLDLLSWALDLDTETIPTVVANATAILAAEIQAKPAKAGAGSSEDLTKRIKAGGVEKENFRPSTFNVPLQSKTAYSMVRPYLSAGQDLAIPGGCPGSSSSQFDDDQGGFGLNGGFA